MALELKAISRVVDGQTHIHKTDLVLEKGSMNVLLGPTLAGKTTLMRVMAGLDAPTSGRLYWDGRDVTGMRVQDRGVAMVYQQFINYPGMSVYENIASPLRLKRRSESEIDKAVRETAELLRLSPFLDRKPLELSGGQQQRCALARALVKGAGLVLLDEPLANLDYKLREELRIEIPRIFEESGAIFVYATTEPEEALLLGGNTATLWEGRVTQFGPTPDVFRKPQDVVTARVFSNPPMNFIGLTKSGSSLRIGEVELARHAAFDGLPDGRFTMGFRANHLELEARAPDAIAFPCRIAATEITGSETFLHLDHGAERWVGLIHGVHDRAAGDAVTVHLDPAHAYVFAADGSLVRAVGRAAAA